MPAIVGPLGFVNSISLVALLIASLVSVNVRAGGDSGDTPLVVAQADSSMGADEAARLVRKRTGGQILSVRAISTTNGVLYRVKVLLPGGRVKVVTVAGSSS